jgi:hypothetical protein
MAKAISVGIPAGDVQPDDPIIPPPPPPPNNPVVIAPTIYKVISEYYGGARDFLLEANVYLYQAVYEVIMLDEEDQEVDLFSPFYRTYLFLSDRLADPRNFIPAVRTLNSHILKRSGYANISSYLHFEDFSVSPSWQALSEYAGYHINNDLVE